MKKLFTVMLLLLFSFSISSLWKISAQQSPFVSDEVFRLLTNEISGDAAMDNLAVLTRFHRPSGSGGYHQAVEFILQKAKEYGLEGAKVIRQKSFGVSWTPKHSELWMIEPEELKLADNREVALSLADYSRPADVTAELVDVGAGDSDQDYEGKDVKGKIVLAYAHPAVVMGHAVWRRGALGIVSYASTRLNPLTDAADQVAWMSVPPNRSADGKEPTFAFVVSPRTGLWLRRLLSGEPNRSIFAASEPRKAQKIILRAKVDSEFAPEPWMEMIEYVLPGSEIHDQDIVLTAHVQEEKFSANDDGSGCVSLLEIARALNRLIAEGRIPRPKRDIRFWWADEIASEYRYFADHPDERKQMLANINQDMVGAHQSQGSRVQHVTRTPYSLPSFLSDVVESVVDFVVAGNTAYLAARQAQNISQGTVFTRPILSRLGSRDRYNALVVPYFDSTDHMVFCDSIVGIPGVTLTNWPDEYIHSSADDLSNVDPTQLKRNAFIVAASALYLANAGEEQVPRLAAEVYSRALERMARDARTALHLIEAAPPTGRAAAYKAARNLIHQAAIREQKAVNSLSVFAQPGGNNAQYLTRLVSSLAERRDTLLLDLDQFYRTVIGSAPPPLELSERERALAKKVPRKIGSVAEYIMAGRRVQGVEGLHALMASEILNFVDGKASILDIFNAVSAESLSVGEFYYGKVTLDMVEKYLNNAVTAKAIAVEER